MPVPRPKAIGGTLAIVLLFATSRWGSQIGAAPLFITDILIAMAIFQVMTADPQKRPPRDGWASRRAPTLTFSLFLAYVVTRMCLALTGDVLLLDWARDAAPYLYGFMAFVAAASLSRSTAASRARTARLLWSALLFHLIWTVVVVAAGVGHLPAPPLFNAPPFSLRPDFDVALLSITAAIALRRWLLGDRRGRHGLVLVLAAATALTFPTRAGQLSLIVALSACWFFTFSAASTRRRTNMVLAVPVLLITAALLLPITPGGERIIATVDPTQVTTVGQVNATGTLRARDLVWNGVLRWVNEDTSRVVFGSGFGNDFLTESHTLQYLEGTRYTGVRSPHNWFVGTYARMGAVGVALVGLVLLQLIRTVAGQRRRFGEDELLFIAGTVAVTLLPVATLGVVLEAPFGAVPFWWCLGIIYAVTPLVATAQRRDERLQRLLDDRARQVAGKPAPAPKR